MICVHRLAALFVAVPGAAGCYRYVPVERPAPLPERGEEVRVELASPQPLHMGTITINDITVIEGDVFRTDGDTLGVFSRRIQTGYGYKQHTDGALFFLPPEDVRRLEVRQIQPLQTALTAVAVAGGVVLGFDLALRAFGGGGSPGDGGGGEDFQVVRP